MPVLKVFKHQSIKAGDYLRFYKAGSFEILPLDAKYITSLWQLYDDNARPFFTPTRNGIKFNHFVGVVKVLDLTIEILPKADKNQDWSNEDEQRKWQHILIEMLRVCRLLETPSVSDASLKLKSNSILDLYIERFIQEVNKLIHTGLIKRYRKEEVNTTSLKGKLLLQKHITKNIVHKERFYVSRSCYDRNHVLHQILAKAIKLLPLICNNQSLRSLSYQLQLNFPEVNDIKADEAVFNKIIFDRKSASYRHAVEIARLLLLNYRPDVSSGSNHSIAILFDMNQLWEEYIFKMLQKANAYGFKLHNQRSTKFWSTMGSSRSIKPDIIIIEVNDDSNGRKKIVIDTKWKNLYQDFRNISMDDLRQMYAYHHYFEAAECFLLYPGDDNRASGNFLGKTYFKKVDLGEKSCGVVVTKLWGDGKDKRTYLNNDIGNMIFSTLGLIPKPG